MYQVTSNQYQVLTIIFFFNTTKGHNYKKLSFLQTSGERIVCAKMKKCVLQASKYKSVETVKYCVKCGEVYIALNENMFISVIK